MGFLRIWRNGVVIAAFCLYAAGQNQLGIPPRATPSDYQAHAEAGTVTIAAEFTGHSIPTPEGPLTTEDYVAVETAFFGPAGARLNLSTDDFSVRINGKKPSPQQPYGMVIGNLKDPEWEPPTQTASKSKTSINGSGKGEDGPPPPVKIPIEVQRAMAQRTKKATLPEGDRALPVAGLIYFQYRGKSQGIHSLELIYAGPAGKATLNLQP
ncbi:MAG: hypothetical protein U0Q18_10855 [Bryobacteraceae bacterium]